MYTSNAFDLNGSNLNISYLDVEAAKGETGNFNIVIEDYTNTVSLSSLQTSKVFIELGKSSATLEHFLIGFPDRVIVSRPQSNRIQYNVTGFGTQIQASELHVSVREASTIAAVDDATSQNDVKFNVNQIIERVLTDKTYRPLKRESIITDLTDWTTAGINADCNVNVSRLNFPPTTVLADFLNELTRVGGYQWFIDYSTGAEVFYLITPQQLHSGIVIKSGDLKNVTSDDPTRTGYVNGSFSMEYDLSIEAGNANRLLASTIIDQTSISSSFSATGSTTLSNKAIAQQFQVSSDTRRITDLALVLSKVGEPESPKSRVNGRIVLDTGDSPHKGVTVCNFEIPLSAIEPAPATIFVNDLDIRQRFLSTSANTKLWLILFQRSGTDGDPNTDNANTIRWHHNNQFSTAQTFKSGLAGGGDREQFDNFNWILSTNGPTYAFGIFANIRRLQSKTNIAAKNTYRLKETVVDASYLSDPASIDLLLTNTLELSSKARLALFSYPVTIPDSFLYRPYRYVTVSDGLSGFTQDLEIQRARYSLSSLSGDNAGLGTMTCEITLASQQNPVLSSFTCDL
ncbi:MAG: hypothetical protein CV087_11120 [Candidatus Brocadia sp. WS118]|nr:MAG: hypothetical protein CV087_11120 [Candidatus Brocadia sp. WS118]